MAPPRKEPARTQPPTPGAPAPGGLSAAQVGAAWARECEDMRRRSEAVDWSNVDWSKLRASDVGFKAAPFLLSEEEFAEYRKRAGKPVHVVKAPTKNS